MVDKIWYDWQQRSPKNRYSYGGGSVAALDSFADFTQFPTGLPPYCNVSVPSGVKRACVIIILSFASLSFLAKFPVMVCGTTFRFGM